MGRIGSTGSKMLFAAIKAMKTTAYFDAVRVRPMENPETRDLDENTILDMDAQGNMCSITVEHASTRADAPHFSYEEVAA
jgi:uncharacterized protein YuzE